MPPMDVYRAGFFGQMLALWIRALICTFPYNVVHFFRHLFLATFISVLLGAIFWNVGAGLDQEHVLDRLGFHYTLLAHCLWPLLLGDITNGPPGSWSSECSVLTRRGYDCKDLLTTNFKRQALEQEQLGAGLSFVPHPLRGSHVRATRFRPALVLKQGCDEAKFEYAYICVFDGVRWSGDDEIFQVVPAERFQDITIRSRIDEFQAILIADHQRVNVSLYDAYYTWGDVLALPGPSAYDHVPGKSFTIRTATDGTLTRYRSPTLNHTYAFAGEYYLTASLRPRVGRDVQLFSITKITVVEEPYLCRPRLQVDGLGPCGRPVAVSAKRPAYVWVRSQVPKRCSQPLEVRTDVQFMVLYPGGPGRPPLVQCSGSTGPPQSCARDGCTYMVTVSKDCLRQGETAKVVLRQMWRGKTDVLIESLAVGYLTATDAVVHASIDGAPIAFLSDAETLVLSNWSCDQCDKNGSLYQAFTKKRLDQKVIEIPDELRYGLSQMYRFVLRVSSDRHGDRATITVRVPGDQDDQMALSCPCCEFGVLSSEDLVVEARPQRTKVWDTRYPLVTWTISGPAQPGYLTEQRGGRALAAGREHLQDWAVQVPCRL
ncbi:hypothetical protein MTO96_021067 [Rhipicephalus appendiculatus]